MANLNPIKVSDYKTREERIKSVDSFSIRDLITLANGATLSFVLLDFAVLFSRWESVQTESWYIVALIAISAALILDVPMMLAGKTIVEYQHKMKSKSFMVIVVSLAVTAFLLVFGFSLWFSYVTRNATFQDPEESMMLVNNMADLEGGQGKDSVAVLVAALYSGVLPLGTSIASMVIALITYKPVEEKRKKISRARVKAQEHLLHLRQGVAECQALVERGKNLIAREEDLYNQFVESVYAQELVRKNAYREALEELCSLDDVNHIIETAKAMNVTYQYSDTPYTQVSTNIVRAPVSSTISTHSALPTPISPFEETDKSKKSA